MSLRRVAALYDIHGNLPALEAVLEDVRQAGVDLIVVGGDVVPGPMPRETIERLLGLETPVQFVHGNGDLAVVAQMAALDGDPVTYWGTTSGEPPPEPIQEVTRWAARELSPDSRQALTGWPKTLRLEIQGIGGLLFCHSTPRSETEIFTRLTPEARLLPIFEGLGVEVVVCGHTHMPFDRRIGGTRVVNAGSVGAPHGEAGAHWLVLGRDVEHRHTLYDLAGAADRVRATAYPQREEMARHILRPPSEEEALEVFTRAELR